MSLKYLCLPIVVVLAACGAPLEEENSSPLRPPLQDESYAAEYFIEDKACQSESGANAVNADYSFFSMQNGQIESQIFDVKNTSSNPALRNPTIRSTFYNFGQVRDCRGFSSADSCGARAKVVSDPQPLKICRSGAFQRDSIEGISMSSMAHLSHARTFYVGSTGADRDIAAANLLVLPKVETLITVDGESRRRVDTDNLAYAPNFGGNPAFVIFPKGKTAVQRGLWDGYSLWELPWGLAHEYGHHIFRTHTGVATFGGAHVLANGMTVETPLHTPQIDEKTETGFSLTSGNGMKEMWSSVNEAFADLFSHYSLGEDSGIAAVDCFAKNRELNVAKFSDGTDKMFTGDVMKMFNGTIKARGDGCTSPNFSDVHSVGAVIAYGANRFLDAAEVADKTKVILKWADQLGQIANDLSDANGFDALLGPLVQAVKADQSQLTTNACSTFIEVFPHHAEAVMKAHATECL